MCALKFFYNVKMIFLLLSDLIESIFDNGLFECAIETAKPFNAFIVELLMLIYT